MLECDEFEVERVRAFSCSFFMDCLVLTNFHIRFHPLWKEYRPWYLQMQHRLYHITRGSVEKRKRIQESYINNRLRRLDVSLRSSAPRLRLFFYSVWNSKFPTHKARTRMCLIWKNEGVSVFSLNLISIIFIFETLMLQMWMPFSNIRETGYLRTGGIFQKKLGNCKIYSRCVPYATDKIWNIYNPYLACMELLYCL